MSRFKTVRFEHGEEGYVAAGGNTQRLTVYEIVGRRKLLKTEMLYPSCLKFMPGVVLLNDTPRSTTSKEFRESWDVGRRRR